jgi:RimJ/RimL family protein N-acetyltransferase
LAEWTELCCYLVPAVCHQGLGQEACQTVLAHVDLDVVARTRVDDARAMACLQALGFRRAGQAAGVQGWTRAPCHSLARP